MQCHPSFITKKCKSVTSTETFDHQTQIQPNGSDISLLGMVLPNNAPRQNFQKGTAKAHENDQENDAITAT